MDKKLIYRIIGAIASALIIVSVFVPFVSVYGYTSSLWNIYKSAESVYLPTMIIVFGVIGVVFFSLNIKTEFAYMSTGAITFFLVMETIDVINRSEFKSLSIGYYCLVIGAILTGVMAFLLNIKQKSIVSNENKTPDSNENMLEKIDQLYDTPTQLELEQPINNVVEEIQPLPVEPVMTSNGIPEPVNPVVQNFSTPEIPTPQINPQQDYQAPVPEPVNPVMQDFSAPEIPIPQINPQQEFDVMPATVNPVVQDFNNSNTTQNTNSNQPGLDIFGQ